MHSQAGTFMIFSEGRAGDAPLRLTSVFVAGEGILFGDDGRFPARKRAPGAPNCAPSLCSVAGLLGRALGRRLRGHPRLASQIRNGARDFAARFLKNSESCGHPYRSG
jgi:cobalamin biosynthesis protein CobD/CbiB